MRLRNLESKRIAACYFDSYEATFDISVGEANYLSKHGALVDYSVNIMSDGACKCTKSRNNIKVIFSDPATILFIGDKKYISKAHGEKFDPEKGLLMCLAKANGISHLDLKRMIKGATYPKFEIGVFPSEEPKKKRGRPRKEKSLEVKPKRPVGRPRKNKG